MRGLIHQVFTRQLVAARGQEMHHRRSMVIGDDVGPVVGIGFGAVLLQERDVLGDLGVVVPGRVAGLL